MKRLFLPVIALAVLFLGSFPLSSPGATPANYAVLKAGIYSPQSSDLTSSGAGFGTGFNGEIAVGHYFLPNLAGEFGIGWFETSGSLRGTDVDIRTTPITLSLRGVVPLGDVEPYFEAGVGIYKTRAKISASGGSATNEDTVGGLHLGLGANFNVTPNVFLGLEARYIWAKPKLSIVGVTVDSALDGYALTANLGYRF